MRGWRSLSRSQSEVVLHVDPWTLTAGRRDDLPTATPGPTDLIAHITTAHTTHTAAFFPLHHYYRRLLSVHPWEPLPTTRIDGPPLTRTVSGGDPPAQRRAGPDILQQSQSGLRPSTGRRTEGEVLLLLFLPPSPATQHAGPTSPTATMDVRRSGPVPK